MKIKIATKIDPYENFISALIYLGNNLSDLTCAVQIDLETTQLICKNVW